MRLPDKVEQRLQAPLIAMQTTDSVETRILASFAAIKEWAGIRYVYEFFSRTGAIPYNRIVLERPT